MTTDIRIIAGGTTNYLINSSGTPTPGGAATAAATTPYSVLNDNWTMQAAQPNSAYQGGPPFRNGSTLAYQAYGNTQQSIPISVTGSTHDNVAALLRSLRQLINQSISGLPAVLYYKPNGATNELYFEIQSGAIAERPGPMNPSAGFTYVQADLILTLQPLGGLLSAGETLINAGTYTVAGSTVTLPTNNTSLGSGAGDLIYEGSPLNIKVTPTTAGSNIGELWCANTFAYANATANVALNVPFSTPITATWTPTQLLAHNNAKLRIIARVFNSTGGAVSKYYIVIRGSAAGTNGYYVTPAPGVSPTIESTGLVDFGPISLDVLRTISPLSGTFNVDFYATKTAGTPTLISVEFLIYVDFCKITGITATQAGGEYLWLNSFRAKTSQVCLPTSQSASTLNSANTLNTPAVLRGQIPRYFSGASLWANWVDSTGNNTTAATRAASVTATHAPLYFTMRGAG